MQTLLTVFALLILCGTAVFAYIAWRAAEDAREIEHELQRSMGRIASIEHETQTLVAQVHKLRGKIYSFGAPERETEIAKPFSQGLICENYKTAQRDGPNCEAARCECEYCEAKRIERKEFRARAVPKTAQEKRDAIEKGRH